MTCCAKKNCCYEGFRRRNKLNTYRYEVFFDGVPIKPRTDLSHVPNGQFSWERFGLYEVALAIVAHATGDDELAVGIYTYFKQYLDIKPDADHWKMPKERVLAIVRQIVRVSP